MFGIFHFPVFPRGSVTNSERNVHPKKDETIRTVRLGRPQSKKGPIFEEQYWMPPSGDGDLLLGLIRIDPMPSEFLRPDPATVVLSVKFLVPFSRSPRIAVCVIGQEDMEVEACSITSEGFQISARKRGALVARDVLFGWIATGALVRTPSLNARSAMRVGVIAEWQLIESLFGAPTPAGAAADAVCDIPVNGGSFASADRIPEACSLRKLRSGASRRLRE